MEVMIPVISGDQRAAARLLSVAWTKGASVARSIGTARASLARKKMTKISTFRRENVGADVCPMRRHSRTGTLEPGKCVQPRSRGKQPGDLARSCCLLRKPRHEVFFKQLELLAHDNPSLTLGN